MRGAGKVPRILTTRLGRHAAARLVERPSTGRIRRARRRPEEVAIR
jgi:hypothetical protein